MRLSKIKKYCQKLHTHLIDTGVNLNVIKCPIYVGMRANTYYKNVSSNVSYFVFNKKTTEEDILNYYTNLLGDLDRQLLAIWGTNYPKEIYVLKPLGMVEIDKHTKKIKFEYIVGWE